MNEDRRNKLIRLLMPMVDEGVTTDQLSNMSDQELEALAQEKLQAKPQDATSGSSTPDPLVQAGAGGDEGENEGENEGQGQPKDSGSHDSTPAMVARLLKITQGLAGAVDNLSKRQGRLESSQETEMIIREASKAPKRVRGQHPMFGELLRNAKGRFPTLLVGPSGGGKSTAAKLIAETLGLRFSYVAMGPTQTEHKFSGFTAANGFLVPEEFYLSYKYGGVMLIDELDNAEPSVLVWLNGSIQNKMAPFPMGLKIGIEAQEFGGVEGESTGGIRHMHPDCVIIATANTIGKGATMIYSGRRPIDGSTLKRFKTITWNYDEKMERRLAGNPAWVDIVQHFRRTIEGAGLPHIVSPVDSIEGAQLVALGKPLRQTMEETFLAGLDKSTRDMLKVDDFIAHSEEVYEALYQAQEKARAQEAEAENPAIEAQEAEAHSE
jgi:hypothetical protein